MAIKTIPRAISGIDCAPVRGRATSLPPPRSSEVDVTTGASWPTDVVVTAGGWVVDVELAVVTGAVVVVEATVVDDVLDVDVDVDVVVG
jgi:hypothetical protein